MKNTKSCRAEQLGSFTSITDEDMKHVWNALKLKEAQEAEKAGKRPLPRAKFCVIIKKKN